MIQSPTGGYVVGKLVAETDLYRLYLCEQEATGQQCLLQIAATLAENGALDRSAYLLARLLREAEAMEEEYAKVKEDPKKFLNYQLGFPELVASFVSAEQGGRRINILRFRGVEDVHSMVPLYNLVHRDRLRVDLRTSVWIMGKLLKILAFFHDAGVVVRDLAPGNVLIEPAQRYVVVFNSAKAELMSDGVPPSTVREEIKAAAQCVIETLGGTMEGGIPDDGSPQHEPYQEHLLQLAREGETNAATAHQRFYEQVDRLWPRGFYPFTTLPRR